MPQAALSLRRSCNPWSGAPPRPRPHVGAAATALKSALLPSVENQTKPTPLYLLPKTKTSRTLKLKHKHKPTYRKPQRSRVNRTGVEVKPISSIRTCSYPSSLHQVRGRQAALAKAKAPLNPTARLNKSLILSRLCISPHVWVQRFGPGYWFGEHLQVSTFPIRSTSSFPSIFSLPPPPPCVLVSTLRVDIVTGWI